MMYTGFILWLAIFALGCIFLYCCWLILRSFRTEKISIAYAGTVHDHPQVSSKVNAKAVDYVIDKIKSQVSPEVNLIPFLVEGNSMQYADIHTGDIVITKEISENSEAYNDLLPQVVVIKDNRSDTKDVFKLRRAWTIVPCSITSKDFSIIIETIIASKKFQDVKLLVKDKCPDDGTLMEGAMKKFSDFKCMQDNFVIISTTYRTKEDRIGFSVHSLQDVIGVVVSVAAKTK